MSVEDARANIERMLYYSALGVPVAGRMLDRLILEVRAEMPCYGSLYERGWDERGFYVEMACPSCTARMKLEETVDAHPCE